MVEVTWCIPETETITLRYFWHLFLPILAVCFKRHSELLQFAARNCLRIQKGAPASISSYAGLFFLNAQGVLKKNFNPRNTRPFASLGNEIRSLDSKTRDAEKWALREKKLRRPPNRDQGTSGGLGGESSSQIS